MGGIVTEYAVDIVLAAIIIIFVAVGLKKGFVSTLLESLSLVISAVGSYVLCNPVSDFIYNTFVSNSIKGKFTEIIAENLPSGAVLSDKTDALLNALPPFTLKLADYAGFNIRESISGITSAAAENTDLLVNDFADIVAYGVLIILIKGIAFVVLFILLSIIVKMLSGLLGKVINKIPLVGKANKALGGALGLIKAIVVVFVVCTVLYFIAGTSSDLSFVPAVESSKIYGFVTANNPMINLL